VDVRRVAVKRWRPPWAVARSGDENATDGSGVSEFWFWTCTIRVLVGQYISNGKLHSVDLILLYTTLSTALFFMTCVAAGLVW
jgi:hypothetical protein